jgi:hypothetical protein
MADLSDVEIAIVSKATGALYPGGISQLSVIGTTCRVYRGWPSTSALNSDLASGIVNVTVLPATTLDEVPDPYFDKWYPAIAATSLTATVVGHSVTFSGTVVGNEIVGLLVDGTPFSYNDTVGDTNGSIAANLVALISASRIADLVGATVTIPGATSIIARVVTNAIVAEELRRQRREVQVSCWCPSPAVCDLVCKTIDLTLMKSAFIELSDNTKAHIRYVSTQAYDQSQNALLYRRDLFYKCEFAVITCASAPIMLFGNLINNAGSSFV